MRYIPTLLFLLLACSSTPTPTEQAEPGPESPYGWSVVPFVDEFGDSTDVAVLGFFPGTFTNSATIGDTLAVKIELALHPLTQDSIIFFHLYEYGNMRVQFYGEGGNWLPVNFKIGAQQDTVHAWLFEDIVAEKSGKLYNVITTATKPVKIALDLSDAVGPQSAKYRFVVDPAGLAEARRELK